jgi:sugar-specific transcriptional regulator TrmB
MIKKAAEYLEKLGLKGNEAKVYLCCLQKPMGCFVHQITEKTEIKRSTVDLILHRLRKDGFIQRHKEGARWIYIAESPDKIAFSMNERLQEFKGFVPALMNSLQDGGMPMVRYYEGKDGIEQVFDDILLTCQRLSTPKNELLILSSGRDLIRLLPDHDSRFIKKRIRRGIPVRILAPDNAVTQKLYPPMTTHLRQTRFFDEKKFSFQTEIDIYDDKIALISFNDPGIMGTVIQNRSLAISLRSLFEMLWAGQKS